LLLSCSLPFFLCTKTPHKKQTFMQTLEQARGCGALGSSSLAVMGRLCGLFGLGLMEAGAGDLLEGGWLSGE
jgi:hypothetical protein